MILPYLATAAGFVLLLWSADRFVEGCAAAARLLGVPALLIGILVVGFGTSAPEMVISALAAFQGNPGLAVGNAYGSNIINIALILGIAALIKPIGFHSQILRKELPVLTAVTALAAFQLWDGILSRADAWVLLGLFGLLMSWIIVQGVRGREDSFAIEMEQDLLARRTMTLGRALTWLVVGMVLLVLSSWILVWGAVGIARGLGISDLVIGLTIVAIGTSLPELASSLAAARKGEHDLAVGNVVGSNLFNTLAVVGIAGAIQPLAVDPAVLSRDVPMMAVLTLSLFLIGYGFGERGRINRLEGGVLVAAYLGYLAILALSLR
jgi:cation:H+ antiporter